MHNGSNHKRVEVDVQNEALVLDMLEWIGAETRPYDAVMSAWRTSCPRLTVWEDSVDAGLVRVEFDTRSQRTVSLTAKGRQFLQRAGRAPIEPAPA